jgi:hypothetical protein
MTTAAFTSFSDVQLFKAQAQPLLLGNIKLNTVALSELHALDHSTPGTFMGTCCCTACNSTAAVFCPGHSKTDNLFYSKSKLYVSDGLCEHAAKAVAAELQGVHWSSLTAPAAAAAAALKQTGGLQVQFLQQMHLMVLQQQSKDAAGTATAAAAAAAAVDTASEAAAAGGGRGVEAPAGIGAPPSTTAATAACPAGSPAGSSMQLRAVSAGNPDDMKFLHSWFADFLQEAMHTTAPPSDSQVSLLLQPWLQQGQFQLLHAAGQPVCLLCHVPTTSSSVRIVLVYTPQQHRRRGHARVAGEGSKRGGCAAQHDVTMPVC